VGELYGNMPFLRKDAAKKNLLKNLEDTIYTVEAKHGKCTGDLPPMDKLRDALSKADWSKFRAVDKKQLDKLDRMVTEEMSKLIAMLPAEAAAAGEAILNGPIDATVDSTPFAPIHNLNSDRWRLSNAGQWTVAADGEKFAKWAESFISAAPVDGKLTGSQAKHIMLSSKLPTSVLAKIWSLADIDQDGQLDEEEFCLAMYLIDYKVDGNDLPSTLPDHLIPKSKKTKEEVHEKYEDTSE